MVSITAIISKPVYYTPNSRVVRRLNSRTGLVIEAKRWGQIGVWRSPQKHSISPECRNFSRFWWPLTSRGVSPTPIQEATPLQGSHCWELTLSIKSKEASFFNISTTPINNIPIAIQTTSWKESSRLATCL